MTVMNTYLTLAIIKITEMPQMVAYEKKCVVFLGVNIEMNKKAS